MGLKDLRCIGCRGLFAVLMISIFFPKSRFFINVDRKTPIFRFVELFALNYQQLKSYSVIFYFSRMYLHIATALSEGFRYIYMMPRSCLPVHSAPNLPSLYLSGVYIQVGYFVELPRRRENTLSLSFSVSFVSVKVP